MSPGGCSPQSCSGCCLNDICQPGDQAGACGTGGFTCQTCTSPATCQAGTCVSPKCDVKSCSSGCCDATGACKPGTEETACGTGAADCVRCQATETCVEHACSAKGPSMYKVTIESAKVTGNSLIVCGFAEFSACDLYVVLKVGNATAQSTIKVNTNDPVWNEYLLTALETSLTTSFEVDVRDDDPIGSVSIGHCQPKVTSTELIAGKLVVDCGDAKQVTFTFQKI
jgi:hypothetical protein